MNRGRRGSGTALSSQSRRHRAVRVVVCALATAVVLAVAACASPGSSGNSGSTAADTTGANVAAATAGLAAFTGKPSAFPVTEPLAKPLPAGSKFVYLDASDPIGAQLAQLLKSAVTAVGGKFIAIPAGETASSAQAAAASALADHPAVVLIPAFLPNEFGGELQALRHEGTQIVGAGMIGWQKYGIQWCVGCEALEVSQGTLLADWVVAHKGAKANAVFYSVPELNFTATMWTAFKAQLAKLCPGCTVRDVPIDFSAIGTTAPQTIVNDLQSHSGTNVAVFSSMDMAQGLPAAMSAAGVNVATIGSTPTPENLQDIKAGKMTAGVALAINITAWTMVDAGAKLAIGQKPQPSEAVGTAIQLLEGSDITFNPVDGWLGYPDYAQRFAKLWHPGK
jgi:ribose transport system substrate-binding protein